MPPITVHIHGDVAVAYGISSEKVTDGKPHKSYFADYYFWKDGAWYVYFAQQAHSHCEPTRSSNLRSGDLASLWLDG